MAFFSQRSMKSTCGSALSRAQPMPVQLESFRGLCVTLTATVVHGRLLRVSSRSRDSRGGLLNFLCAVRVVERGHTSAGGTESSIEIACRHRVVFKESP